MYMSVVTLQQNPPIPGITLWMAVDGLEMLRGAICVGLV